MEFNIRVAAVDFRQAFPSVEYEASDSIVSMLTNSNPAGARTPNRIKKLPCVRPARTGSPRLGCHPAPYRARAHPVAHRLISICLSQIASRHGARRVGGRTQ